MQAKGSLVMSSPTIATLVKMMESLPENVQEQVLDHLREYIDDLQDELQWDTSFKQTQTKLIQAAQRAKQEIAQGLSSPLDYDQL
jgi:archaellum biogenesis ATPase FlaH